MIDIVNNQKEALAQALFNTVASQLLKRLEQGDYTHQDMKNAIEFLKNNSITCDSINPEVVVELLGDIDLPITNIMEAN